MKKLVLVLVAAILALLSVLFGRDLLDLCRLMQFVERSTAAYEANGGKWPQLADVCSGCHGDRGNSRHQGYPSLAGQPAAYIAAQLQAFASGQRASPTMGPLAMTLSAAEIQWLSNYYARQPADENRAFEPAQDLRDNGQRLVTGGGCAACHGPGLMGQGSIPRLAGQGHDYLLAQLDAFASGTRTDPSGAMQGFAAAASPQERKAMATYLASLAPQNPSLAKAHQE